MKERTKQTLRQIRMRATALLMICAMAVTSMSSFAGMDVFAATSGICGDNLTWTLNTTTGVLTINGNGPMYNYNYDAPWYDNRTSIKDVKINGNITSIGTEAFVDCKRLTSITIPDSVKSINDRAFLDCSKLESVKIGSSVTSIGTAVFANCSNLTSLTIPASVTSIGKYVFSLCSSMTSINVDKNNRNYSSNAGVIFNKSMDKLIYYPSSKKDTSYIIPDSVTSIGYSAFSNCNSLTSVTISDSVTSIGECAFVGCSSLKSVIIPDSVTSIGDGAFDNCAQLSSITIPDSVTSIGDDAFSSCNNLTSIKIGKSVTSIGSYAFSFCTNLKDVYYNGSEANWKKISVGSSNNPLVTAKIHYNSATTKVGDVNNDGKVNGKDSTLLMQYLAGWDVQIDKSAADLNSDGKINGKDSTLLMQHLAGWDVSIG